MPGIQRIRVLTPEALDGKAADYVGTTGSELRTAILTLTGSGDPGISFVSTATANTGMKRDASARAQVANPSANLDIVNKQTMDTAVAAKVSTTSLGAASGVATLDSGSKLTGTQIPTFLTRNQGTGTSFPGGIARGDVFHHSGIGCLFMYDGTNWGQSGRCTVATRTARNTLSSTYSSVLPRGFRITQTDHNYRWRWEGAWIFDGWADSTYPYGKTTPSLEIRWQRNNYVLPNGRTGNVVDGWTVSTANGSGVQVPAWITYNSSARTWSFNDNAVVHAVLTAESSHSSAIGKTEISLHPPGGTSDTDRGIVASSGLRYQNFTQPYWHSVAWQGYVSPGQDAASVGVFQINNVGATINYNFYISFKIFPG